MKQIHSNWFKVLIIQYYLMLIIYARTTPFSKSNDTTQNLFPLSLIHINDFHARFEETNELSLECKHSNDTCIGGYARLVAVVKELQKTRTNPIYLNAGDNFAGTIWYSFGKWNVTQHFLNMLPADVMTVGNHEFDDGNEKLALFLDTIRSPIVLANADVSDEPDLDEAFLNSTIIVRDGRKIGVIGLIKSDIYSIAKTGNIKFLDEIETVRRESEKLDEQGVDIILVLSHCGVDVDLEVAEAAGSKVDVIVGAHTHTFMYTGDPPGPDEPEYEYPTVIEHENGHTVLVVQAAAFAKYVGDLTVYFDDDGEVVRWFGQPIFLAPNIQPDVEILNELKPWKDQFRDVSQKVITSTDIVLDASKRMFGECIMCNVIADSFLNSYHRMRGEKKTAIALIQAGGVRVTLPKGPITYGDILTLLPFGNRADSYDLLGKYIWDMMERSVSEINKVHTKLDHMLHVSGMKLVLNATEPVGKRLISIKIRCEECSPVRYQPIEPNRSYRVISTDFLAQGGNGYTIIPMHYQNYQFGEIDSDALLNYFKSIQKVKTVDVGRITILN